MLVPLHEKNYNSDFYHVVTEGVIRDHSIANVVLDVTYLHQWMDIKKKHPNEAFLTIEENGDVTDGNGNVLDTTVKPKRQMYLVTDYYEHEIDGKIYSGVVTLLYPEEY